MKLVHHYRMFFVVIPTKSCFKLIDDVAGMLIIMNDVGTGNRTMVSITFVLAFSATCGAIVIGACD